MNKKEFSSVKYNQGLSSSTAENFTGFTLIELLIVIGIISILAAGVIVAINPGQQFASARDITRERHVNSLQNALISYQVENQGNFSDFNLPEGKENLTEICNTNLENQTCGSLIDLSSLVNNDHINQIPVDPQGSVATDADGTGYFIAIENNKIILLAKNGENSFIGIGITEEEYTSNTVDPEDMQWAYSDCTDFGNNGGFSGGSGTEADPYQIIDLHELQAMKCDLSAYYVLQNDIDAKGTEDWNSGAGWDPIGDSENYFEGSFDGQDNVIDGLYINRPAEDFVGLFGYYINGSENTLIKDVNLVDFNITGNEYVGSLIGLINSGITIDNVNARGGVSGTTSVGGVLGLAMSSYLNNFYADVEVVSQGSAGGLYGHFDYGECHNSFSKGSVTGDVVGGIGGTHDTYSETHYKVTNCASIADVSGTDLVGGLFGRFISSYTGHPKMKNSYYAGVLNFSSANTYGGLIADSYTGYGLTVTDCFLDKDISGTDVLVGNIGDSGSSIQSTALTTAEMKNQSSYTNWDFTNTWTIDPTKNNGYPYLQSFTNYFD